MVARQALHPATSAAAAGAHHTNTPSTSSIKPTGWIRSNSASKPSAAPLSDRTNLPTSSRHTPVRSLSKPTAAPASVQSVHNRTPTTSVKGAGGKQQKLSSFFAPNTAPPAAPAVNGHSRTKSILYQDSPSADRAQRSHSSNGSVGRNEGGPSKLAVLEDEELEARAANLLRGRFGSLSRSLNPSRSSTPTRAASPPRSDPDPPRLARVGEPSMSRPRLQPPPQQRPQPQPMSPPKTHKQATQVTPPRLKRYEQQQPPSSPMFHQTLMQESLSNFTPPAWEKARGNNMALFQRLAGLPTEEIREWEKKKMEEELEKAHRRMQGSSPTGARGKHEGRKKMTSPLRKEASSSANRVKQAAALSSALPRKAVQGERPQTIMRSPRTKRRIYALETQLAAVPCGTAISLQPFGHGPADGNHQQRRAASEARYSNAGTSRHHSILPAARQMDPMEEDSETQPLPWPEESETQPLAWPDEENDVPDADTQPDAAIAEGEETQLLPWNDEEESDPAPPIAPTAGLTALAPHLQNAVAEIPTSDDEDLLLQPVIVSSSSPPASPLQSRSTSPTSSSLHPHSPAHKRRRIDPNDPGTSPTLIRTPIQRLPKVSPITLTPTTPGQNGSRRFDRVVAALRKEERRQNTGMQLSLNGFISQRKDQPTDEQMEQRRAGLSEDLDDVLSDDDDDPADRTLTRRMEGEGEGDETQPLPWSSPESQLKRPGPLPLQSSQPSPATQRTYTSTTSSSSSASGMISVPSQTNLREAGGSQLVNFIDRL